MEFDKLPSSIKKLYDGNTKTKEYLGREAINQFETTCLSVFVMLSEKIQRASSESISEAIIAQDMIERQNCQSDELKIKGSVWKETSFPLEYSRFVKQISDRYSLKFGEEEGKNRRNIVIDYLRNWYLGNQVLEEYIRGTETNKTERFQDAINRIEKEDIKKEIVFKEEIDRLWLESILSILCEGDKKAVDNLSQKMLNLTMLFQLSEDFSNINRDHRIDKKSTITHIYDKNINEKLSFLFNNVIGYIDDSNYSPVVSLTLFSGLLAKTIVAYAKSFLHQDEWRSQKDYHFANSFETKRFHHSKYQPKIF